jgi:TetR/AcrR family transcriptional regulator
MSPSTVRDPELTQERILEAALQLFVQHGAAAVSMRQIATASGVTKSLIHHHFGSKEALWNAAKDQAFSLYADGQRAELENAGAPMPSLLENSVVRYFRFLQQHPDVVRMFAWAHLEQDDHCGDVDAALVALGAARIREAQQAGFLRDDVNPTHVVTIFVNACTHWFNARAHHARWPGIGSDEEYLEDFLKVFMSGLLPRQAAPTQPE